MPSMVAQRRHFVLRDRGKVTCLKLSPNLRQIIKSESGQKAGEGELAKLSKVLQMVKKENLAP